MGPDEFRTFKKITVHAGNGYFLYTWNQDYAEAGNGLSPGTGVKATAIIGDALAAGTFVVCHDTLTYGDFPDYGPAICRGFYDAYKDKSPRADPAPGIPAPRRGAPADNP